MRSLRPRADPDREAGFTLVEVLVAFAIIALTVTMALRVLADGAGAARRGPAQMDRVDEAASIVDGIIADPQPASAEQDGVFTDGSRWHVRMSDVTARVMPAAKTRLMRIELFLGSHSTGRPLFVTLAGGPAP